MIPAFNFWKNEALDLQEGEEICEECNGEGTYNMFNDRPAQFSTKRLCPKCYGDGKFDWIEKVMGKPVQSSSTSSGGGGSTSSMSYSDNKKKENGRKRVRRVNETFRARRALVPQMQGHRSGARTFPLARSSL